MVKIDEVDVVAADPVCTILLQRIASKCRSECVALIVAGQRATARWMGGADLQANVDIALLGRFARAAEARHATSDGVTCPTWAATAKAAPASS